LARPTLTSFRILFLTALSFLVFSDATAQGTPPPLQQAFQKFQGQEFPSAIEILAKLTTDEPENGQAWMLLGRSHLGSGDAAAAREAFGKAGSIEQNRPQALFWTGLSYASESKPDDAFVWLQKAKDTGAMDMTQIGLTAEGLTLEEDPRYRELFPSVEEYADPFVESTEILWDWKGEGSGDQFGWVARNLGDLDGDGLDDVGTTAPTWSDGRGKVYVYSSGTGALLWEATGEEGAGLGNSIEAAGDVNADGIPDVVAGAPSGNRVHIYSGKDGSILRTISSPDSSSIGNDVVTVGDQNGDGHADVLIGAPGFEGGRGHAQVISGKDGAVIWERSGEGTERFGSAVGGWRHGLVNLFAIGAPNGGENGGGRTYVFRDFGQEPAFIVEPDSTGSQNGGMFVSLVGDVDADGVPDVYSSDWNNGANGPGTGRIYIHSGATGARLYTMTGEAPGDGFGIGVADAGDVDADGHDDLVIGAWQHASAAISGGKAYVYSGNSGELLYEYTGKVPGETFGFDTTNLGDVNGDGIVDFLFTSAWSGINGTRSGRTLVVAGRRP